MTAILKSTVAAFALLLATGAASAQRPIKIGVIMEYSGQFADTSVQIDNGIKLFMGQNGDVVAGRKIEIIRRDTGGVAPDIAKRLAQELVTRDGVDILAGFAVTPNALAVADISEKAKKFMVVMNAATSIITTKSPYMARTSYTLAQVAEPLGAWAYKDGGRNGYMMVLDLGPGHDAEQAYQKTFADAGGKIVGSVRFPLSSPDFSAYVQRAKDINPDTIFVFVPGGAQPASLASALATRGINTKQTRIVGNDVLTSDSALQSMGDVSIGIITGAHYDHALNTPINRDFVKAYREAFKRNPDLFSVGGYDGMRLIYDVLKKTQGNTDGQALVDAAKSAAWESPRGPVSIDPATRDIIQNVYIRRVEKVDGQLVNVEFDKIPNVKDPIKERMKN